MLEDVSPPQGNLFLSLHHSMCPRNLFLNFPLSVVRGSDFGFSKYVGEKEDREESERRRCALLASSGWTCPFTMMRVRSKKDFDLLKKGLSPCLAGLQAEWFDLSD